MDNVQFNYIVPLKKIIFQLNRVNIDGTRKGNPETR